jgi:GntR family transcriptional repressor for pyruvate dehydrogenase complex
VSEQQVDHAWASAPASPRTSVDEVLTRLKNMVHVGELGPGDRLPPERQLCEMLQVSRSTLREGLRSLRTEGYIEVRRGSSGGHFISHLDEPYARWLHSMRENPDQLQEIIEVRQAVEGEVARIAAERRDPVRLASLLAAVDGDPTAMTAREFRDADAQFHLLLADAAGNARLRSLMSQARGELFAPASSPLIDRQTMLRSAEQHRGILDAVRAGEAEDAARLMREHLRATFDDVRRAISEPVITVRR